MGKTEAPQRLERKLQRFEADARLGLSHPLRLDEAEVNSCRLPPDVRGLSVENGELVVTLR